MQVAIISDIHANLQAWNAVLLDIRHSGIKKIICLGDIVGYGPNPAEVMESVYANVDYFVLGNHDAVICRKLDPSLFNQTAHELIEWTRDRLGPNAMKFLGAIPLTLQTNAFRCAHGDLGEPASFDYVIDPGDATPSWNCVDDQLIFIGHTHVPAIHVLGSSGVPRTVAPQDFALEEGKRYIVNVGSVGQPRDGDSRASYCIYDTTRKSVLWRRIAFDLDAYRVALKSVNLPEDHNYFLKHDPRLAVPPLRELLSFTPAATPDQAVRDVEEVQHVERLERSISKWKFLAAILFLLVTAAACFIVFRDDPVPPVIPETTLCIPAPDNGPLDAKSTEEGRNILSLPSAPVAAGEAIPCWSITLGDSNKQSVAVTNREPGRCDFLFASSSADTDITISSPPILVEPGMKLCIEGFFLRSPDFKGAATAEIALTSSNSTSGATELEHFVTKEPRVSRQGGWLAAKQTFTIPRDGYSIRAVIRGKFTGSFQVRDIKLSKPERH